MVFFSPTKEANRESIGAVFDAGTKAVEYKNFTLFSAPAELVFVSRN